MRLTALPIASVLMPFASPAAATGSSENPNQVVSGCFHLGREHTSQEATATLCALLVRGATQFSCPDGSRLHDHVTTAAPGYTGAWTVVRVTPGPKFDAAEMPYTSEAEVVAGVAAGELVLTETGCFSAPVTSAR